MASVYTDNYALQVSNSRTDGWVAARASGAMWNGKLRCTRGEINFATTTLSASNADTLYIARLPEGAVIHDIFFSSDVDLSNIEHFDVGLVGIGSSATDDDDSICSEVAGPNATRKSMYENFNTANGGIGEALTEPMDVTVENSDTVDITTGILRTEVWYSTRD